MAIFDEVSVLTFTELLFVCLFAYETPPQRKDALSNPCK